MSHVFREIDGFPSYLVTDDGMVFSKTSRRFLSPRMSSGYPIVVLCKDREKNARLVHVLVAESFLGRRPPGLVVNHKNGIRTDNRAENLEWVTQSENVKHAYRSGLRVINEAHRNRASELGKAKRSFTEDQYHRIRDAYTGRRGDIARLSEMHGLSRHAVSGIVRGAK